MIQMENIWQHQAKLLLTCWSSKIEDIAKVTWIFKRNHWVILGFTAVWAQLFGNGFSHSPWAQMFDVYTVILVSLMSTLLSLCRVIWSDESASSYPVVHFFIIFIQWGIDSLQKPFLLSCLFSFTLFESLKRRKETKVTWTQIKIKI